jgi:hypothetical protein
MTLPIIGDRCATASPPRRSAVRQFSDTLHKIVTDCLGYEPTDRPNPRAILDSNATYFEERMANPKTYREILFNQAM